MQITYSVHEDVTMFTICHSRETESPFYAYNILPHEYGLGDDTGSATRPPFTATLLLRDSLIDKYYPQANQKEEFAKFYEKFMDEDKFYLAYGHLVENCIFKNDVRKLTFCIQVNRNYD